MARLRNIRRGVKDPAATAAWLGWLVNVEPEPDGDCFRLSCANGTIVIHGDVAEPVSLGLVQARTTYRGLDPDGVPVTATDHQDSADHEAATRLDHVRLNCADLDGAAAFYRQLGLRVTWSGLGDDELDGPQEAPLDGATWMHLSGVDGYLSLSQADWQDCGRHSTASGPPRFIHVGLAVEQLEDVTGRLDGAGIHYLRGHPAVGRNVYVNDPDGDPRLGTNVEVIEYQRGVSRSGQGAG